MKLRTTFLLLILNVAVFFFLFRQESPFNIKEQMGPDDISLLPVPLTEATGITVEGSLIDQSYELKLEDGHWKIIKPIHWDANTFAIRRMISLLEAAEPKVRFPVDDIHSRNQTLADFGLEDPTLVVKVAFGEQVYECAFGAPVEINDQLYMLNPSKDEILVVSSNLVQPFLVGIEQLRSHSLFTIPLFEIRSLLIEFRDDNSRRRFSQEEGNWTIDSPTQLNASNERVQGAIDRLVNYQVDLDLAVESESQNNEVAQFDANTIARFEIIGNRRSSTLLISRNTVDGIEDENLYRARFEGMETNFLIPRSEIDWWRNSHVSLRERSIVDINPNDISKIEVQAHGDVSSTLRLLKLENHQWRIYAGEEHVDLMDYNGDAELITGLITELNDLVALSFVNDQPTEEALVSYGLDQPKTIITLEGKTNWALSVGNQTEDGQQVYIRLNDSDPVYLVAQELIGSLKLDPLYYRSRNIDIVPEDQTVIGFKVIEKESGHVTDGTSMESLLKTARHLPSQEDAEAVFAAIKALLNDFKVSGFLKAKHKEGAIEYGIVTLDLPFELEIWCEGQETVAATMELSKRLSGSEQIAWIDGELGYAVRLKQELVDLLHPLIFVTEVPEEWAPAAVVEESNGPEEAITETSSEPADPPETAEAVAEEGDPSVLPTSIE